MGPDGRYTGNLELYAYGPGKAIAMKELADAEGIDLESSYAYSDSVTDIPMLELVGHPVVVNPDAELRTYAEEKGWEVRKFVSPVSARDRISDAKLPGAAVAGSVAALVTYWALRGRRSSQ